MLDLTQIDMASDEDKAYGIDTWATVFKAKTWEELRMAGKFPAWCSSRDFV